MNDRGNVDLPLHIFERMVYQVYPLVSQQNDTFGMHTEQSKSVE